MKLKGRACIVGGANLLVIFEIVKGDSKIVISVVVPSLLSVVEAYDEGSI